MKKAVLLAVFAAVVAGGVFAQEQAGGRGYIKPTFGLGFAAYRTEYRNQGSNTEGLFALSLDVDFVNTFGLTFGLQAVMAWSDDIPVLAMPVFGLGYTYSANVWCVGAKLMAVPLYNAGLGFDINGTYWFSQNIGITGIMDIYFSVNDIDGYERSVFSMRVGLSTRF